MARVALMMAAVVVVAIAVFQLVPLADSPDRIFQDVWEIFDEHYALFELKGIDWRALGDEHGSRVGPDSSDEELFDVLAGMLARLDDGRVELVAPSLDRSFNAGGLDGAAEPSGGIDHRRLDDRVSYLHVGALEDDDVAAATLDSILAATDGARAWIVDARSAAGDDHRAATAVADRFADRRRLAMVSRIRNGPDHDDFSAPRYWHVDPAAHVFTGPVVLLTDRRTTGAAEALALAMRVLPHVTVVGDTTSGSMADRRWFNLHNGWRVSVSRTVVMDYADRCWEGIGVPPDVVVATKPTGGDDDPALAAALELLAGDGPPLQDESASAAAARYDLVEILEELLESGEFPAVGQEFARIRSEANPENCRVDRDDINALGYRMLRDERLDDAVGVFRIYVELLPQDANAHDSLGEAYMERGDTELAIASYERSLELDPGNRNAVRMLRRLQ